MSFYKNASRYLFIVFFCVFQTPFCQLQTRLQALETLIQESIKKKDNEKDASYASEIGDLYTANKQNINAIKYFDQAISYGKKASDNTLLYGLYGKTGALYTNDKSYSKAIDSFQKALLEAKTLKTADYIIENEMQLASQYKKTEKYKRAIEVLEEVLSRARKQNDITLQQKFSDQQATSEPTHKSQVISLAKVFTIFAKSSPFNASDWVTTFIAIPFKNLYTFSTVTSIFHPAKVTFYLHFRCNASNKAYLIVSELTSIAIECFDTRMSMACDIDFT